MKPLVVKNQVRIGPARCFGLTLTGMSYRMFRSMVTVSILALAVAFLAHVLGYSVIENRTRLAAYRQLRDARLLGEWTTRLTVPDDAAAILSRLAGADGPRVGAYRTWSGATEAEFASAREAARSLARLYGYLEGLPVATRTVLVADLEPHEAAGRLSEAQRFEAFLAHLKELRLEPPLGSVERFRAVLTGDRPEALAMAERIRRGQEAAIRRIEAAYPGRSPRELFAYPPPDFAETLAAAGFELPQEALPKLAALARQAEEQIRLTEAVKLPDVARALAKELDLKATEVTHGRVLAWLDSRKKAAFLGTLINRYAAGPRVEPQRLLALAESLREQSRLSAAVGEGPPPVEGGGLLTVPGWVKWLIGLSFLVCTVGVANAMFMSVAERFAEIATMKCLGAMDGFIRLQFLFESGTQGLVGAIAGIILGYALAMLRGAVAFGSLMVLPVRETFVGAAACLASGLVLAVLAAVGPAWAAARLAPMEAMRIE